MQLPIHIVGVFVTPPFFPKKEVGPWFNPDSYRDRLGSKNLPIGGFFAFWGIFSERWIALSVYE